MLELQHLSAGYSGETVLHDVSLSFPFGSVLGILGPNGSGKSTLLRAALGLIPRCGGNVLVDGLPLASLSPRLRAQKIAYLPQFRNVPDLSVERLVLHGRFPYMSYPRHYSAEDRAIAAQALAAVGAEALASLPLKSLSGGQRQRVYLAMVLAQDSDTVLLDEPTTYLDITHQLQLASLARKLASDGKAVALVLHDLPLAFSVSDQLALLEGGSLAVKGTPEELFSSPWIPGLFGVRLCRTDSVPPHYYCQIPFFREELHHAGLSHVS